MPSDDDRRLVACPRCGVDWSRLRAYPIRCACGNVAYSPPDQPQPPPSVIKLGVRYARSWARWTISGQPARDPGEVERIRELCRGCEHYKDGACGECGCSIDKGQILGDKPEWATEHCPLDPPLW